MTMVRAWILLALLILCASPALGDEAADLATMAARVTHYPTKFRLIAKGRAAVPALMAQVASDDVRLAFESKSALRWIVNHARRDDRDVDALANDLGGYWTQSAAVSLFAIELLGELGSPKAVIALGGLTGSEALGMAAAIEDGYPIITTVKRSSAYDLHWVVLYGCGRAPNRVFVAGNGWPYLDGHVLPWVDFRRVWSPRGEGLVCWGR